MKQKYMSVDEILHNSTDKTREYNIGKSNYSKYKIQPWDIWIEYKLNPFDADIVKRVLRHKKTTPELWRAKGWHSYVIFFIGLNI